ncbi:hypothetical protein LCGC14_2274160 [marine sediment metagenome]|uniref:Uncharacterized protein n=1 Tax=marine sediment metagenome TaxID=412755 RepID=A0A0F9F8J9_9ZZZZ
MIADLFVEESPARRYLSLATAQALACNRCGDCCDSRRAVPPGAFTWGSTDPYLYRDLNHGETLVWPLGAGLRPIDPAAHVGPHVGPFYCAAFREEDGLGCCRLYDGQRPPTCAGFPVFYSDMAERTSEDEPFTAATGSLPRCTWFRVTVLPDGARLLDPVASALDSDGTYVLPELPPSMLDDLAAWVS